MDEQHCCLLTLSFAGAVFVWEGNIIWKEHGVELGVPEF